MRSFPAFVPLEGRRVAVIGAGEAAEAKARLFEGSPADLARFESPPSAEALKGVALVFIALDDPGERTEALAAARQAGALANVVDQPRLSDFYTPAIVDRGELVIGVSTSGAAPTLARDLRARIELVVPAAFGALADFARAIRHKVLARHHGVDARRRVYEAILRGAAGEAALAGDASTAEKLADQIIGGAVEARGVVHLVGAGPGDPDLLTLKALRVLQDADIVFHDRLVDPRVLDLIRRDAARVYVGKAKGAHAVPQAEIAQRLIAEARKGKRVVRLKGGDPFIFGRGGEELEALKAAGVEAHVVAGITAAIGCAAEAGVPLTHRGLATGVTFVTGHAKEGGTPALDWKALAAIHHTLVVYMGVETAPTIAAKLIEAGRAPSIPVAVIENGTTPRMRRIVSRLDRLAEDMTKAAIDAPSVLIIGEVAAFASEREIAAILESAA